MAIPVAVKGSIAGWVVENDKSLIINDVSSDPRFSSGVQEKTGYITKSMTVVPLRVKQTCIGVIELLNKENGIPFDEDDLSILELLSVQAGIAYQNAATYRQARNEIHELENALAARSEFHKFIAADPVMLDLIKVIGFDFRRKRRRQRIGSRTYPLKKRALFKTVCVGKLRCFIGTAFGK